MEEFIRDNAMAAAILGTFAMAWFGWAQDRPPKGKLWPALLGVGSGVSLILASIGGFVAWQNWNSPSALSEGGFSGYIWIFIVELVLIAIAAISLLIAHKRHYIPTVVGTIVGVHFYLLAPIFQDAGLYILATVTTIGALYPLFVAKRWKVPLETLTCVSVAIALFIFATRGLLLAL